MADLPVELYEPSFNPFVLLRLGQCLFELGNFDTAAQWLARAYLSEGTKIFGDDDPKYVEFVKAQLKAPPAGWPEGW